MELAAMPGRSGVQGQGADQRRGSAVPAMDARVMRNPGRDGRMMGQHAQEAEAGPPKTKKKKSPKKKWKPPAWEDGDGQGVSSSRARPVTEPDSQRPNTTTKPRKKKEWEPPKWDNGDENVAPVAQKQIKMPSALGERRSPPTELSDAAASQPSPRPPSSPRTTRSATGSARPSGGHRRAAMGDTCAAAPPKKKVSASERQRHVQATRARKDAAARESLLERQARKHSSSGATSGGDSGPIATLEAELANQSLSSAARYGLEKRLKTLKAAAARAARKKATGASSTASRTDPELVPPEPAGIQAPAPPSAATAALAPLNECGNFRHYFRPFLRDFF